MSLTRTAARTRIRTLIYEPTARAVTDAEINSWIDDACHDISIKTFCSQVIASAITTTSGISTYAYPITLNTTAIETLHIKTVLSSAGVALEYVPPQMIGRLPASQGNFTWSQWQNKIVLYPTPTTAGTFTPYIWVAQGCTAAGTIGLPVAYHHLIPLYGHYKALQKKRDFDAADRIWKQYEMEMKSIAESITSEYKIVQDTRGMKDQPTQE